MAEETLLLEIKGMTCDGCAQTIKRNLKQAKGVKDARVDWRSGVAEVTFDPDVTDEEQILANRAFQGYFEARPAYPGCC